MRLDHRGLIGVMSGWEREQDFENPRNRNKEINLPLAGGP